MATVTEVHHETYMLTMTPCEWAAVPDNPRQRDTESRLSKAKHLNVLQAAHTLVHMAEWDGGSCKLEGHTRALKWQQCPEIAPESVDVRVYVVDGPEQAKVLYGHFNSKEEGERANDRLFGAMREAEITPLSDFVRKAKFSNAVSMAFAFYADHSRSKDIKLYEKVCFFRNEIVLLDSIAGNNKRLISPCVVCFLMSSKKHGDKVVDFFSQYLQDGGIKDGRRKDCVQMFSDVMLELRKGGFCDWNSQQKAVSKGLWCIGRWIAHSNAMNTRIQQVNPWSYANK